MGHRLLGQDPRRMVVDQHAVDEVHHLRNHQGLVLGCDEFGPRLAERARTPAATLSASRPAAQALHVRTPTCSHDMRAARHASRRIEEPEASLDYMHKQTSATKVGKAEHQTHHRPCRSAVDIYSFNSCSVPPFP